MISLFPPKHPIQTSIQLAGSKSISNRLLLLQAVLGTDLQIQNLSNSEDTQLLQNALLEIENSHLLDIDLKQAGTPFRFLTAYLATKPGKWILNGSERMKERPIAPLVNALRQLGANIRYLEKENYPPLEIKGQKLHGSSVELDVGISSQFVSALLLIGPLLEKGLRIKLLGNPVSEAYTKMTIALLEAFGFNILQKNQLISFQASPPLEKIPTHFEVESDWSSASYWYSICALSSSATIKLSHLHPESWQADAVLPQLFDGLGVKTTFQNGLILLEKKAIQLQRFEYNFSNCPDIAQTLATCCFALNIPAKLTGLKTLQLKESKRIDTLASELKKLGAIIEVTEDLMIIHSERTELVSIPIIDTHHDHRLAMSFAPLAYLFPGIKIEAPEVVDKSYPGFWEDLLSVGFSLNLQS